MAIPNTSFSFPANGLGNAPPSPSGIIAVVGPTSAGTANDPRSLGGSAQSVANVVGYGPAPDLAGNLAQSGATVVVVKSASTAGVVGAVTQTGTGTAELAVTGNSFDRYDVIVRVVRAGVFGDPMGTGAGVTVSFDNGRTTTAEIRVPVNGVISQFAAQTGLTLTFSGSADTFVVGDTYRFSAAAPTSTAAQVVTALQALGADNLPFSYVYVTGSYSASDCITINSAIGALRTGQWFVGGILESADVTGTTTEADWMDGLLDAFVGIFQSNFTSIAAGYIGVQSALLGWYPWRSVGWLAAIRLAVTGVSRDLAAQADGALAPYTNASAAIKGDFVPTNKFVHDERTTPGLDAARFLTIRSFTGDAGYYLTNPRVFSAPTSDYKYIQYVRIANEAARLANIFWRQQLSSDVLLNRSTGFILESAAIALERGSDQQLQPLVDNQDVSALATVVARDDDIINTETLTVTIQIVPKGYIKQIPISITFSKTLS